MNMPLGKDLHNAIRSLHTLEKDDDCSVRIVKLADLTPEDIAAWSALSETSGGANIFAEPWFLTAGLRNFDPQGEARLFIVQQGDAWIGVMAIKRAASFGPVPAQHWQSWGHANQFLGKPLVRKDSELIFWKQLLTMLDQRSSAYFGLLCNDLPMDGRVMEGLRAYCAVSGRSMTLTRQYKRAALHSDLGFEDYWSNTLSRKRASRLRNLANRLRRDHGDYQFERLTAQDDLSAWIDEFVALEDSGWKQRSRSSVKSCDRKMAFFREVAEQGFAHGNLELLALRVQGKAIAMSAHFFRGNNGYGFKMGYDERYAAYGPGILLLQEISRVLDRDGSIYFDSCSAPDQEPVNTMWQQRRTVVDCCISLKGWQKETTYRTIFVARKLWHQSKLIPYPYFV